LRAKRGELGVGYPLTPSEIIAPRERFLIMWTTLISSLTDKPENHPIVRAKQVETEAGRAAKRAQRKQTEEWVINAIRDFGEASVKDIAELIPSRSEKHLMAVCSRLMLRGVIDYRYPTGVNHPCRYWRLK
jgi:hypothetical protein